MAHGDSSFSSCLPSGNAEKAFTHKHYINFKRSFVYARFTYCYYCGSPQDQNWNGKAPACHKQAGFGSKPCPWADFPYAVVYSIWHTGQVREKMISNFRLEMAMSYDKFRKWCTEEYSDKGEYTKMLEVFLWYCNEQL